MWKFFGSLFFLWLVFAVLAAVPLWEQVSSAKARSQVVLLGSGTPNADPDRSGPCVAIVVNGTPYLVDFGPGVVRRAAAAHRKGVTALDVKNLRTAFVTHLHSDHTAGLPDLILTPWVLERDQPLRVYGPPGIKSMTEHLLKAYAEDIRIRLDGLEPANSEGYKLQAFEVEPGWIYQDGNVRVKAFPVRHGSWPYAYGYRFETSDRVIVVSGDTAPSPSVAENCNGCDVLVHEVYSLAGFRTRPPEWQKYHSSFHTSTEERAEIARQARPKLLVLYHQLLWSRPRQELLSEIRQRYQGKVVFGNDLEIY